MSHGHFEATPNSLGREVKKYIVVGRHKNILIILGGTVLDCYCTFLNFIISLPFFVSFGSQQISKC